MVTPITVKAKGSTQLHSYEVAVEVNGKIQRVIVENQPDARSAEIEAEKIVKLRGL